MNYYVRERYAVTLTDVLGYTEHDLYQQARSLLASRADDAELTLLIDSRGGFVESVTTGVRVYRLAGTVIA
jgi:hypothetical protein